MLSLLFFFFKQKTAYEMRISDWSSDVCSSDLFYDPMIAKVIAWGEDREEARELLSGMLEDSAIWPVKTNSAFLINALGHPDFVAGTVGTGLKIGRASCRERVCQYV